MQTGSALGSPQHLEQVGFQRSKQVSLLQVLVTTENPPLPVRNRHHLVAKLLKLPLLEQCAAIRQAVVVSPLRMGVVNFLEASATLCEIVDHFRTVAIRHTERWPHLQEVRRPVHFHGPDNVITRSLPFYSHVNAVARLWVFIFLCDDIIWKRSPKRPGDVPLRTRRTVTWSSRMSGLRM